MATAKFRILHLSDFHFSRKERTAHLIDWKKANVLRSLYPVRPSYFYPTTYDPDIAKLLAGFIYYQRSSIDLALISGDLATTGLRSDLMEAWQYLCSRPIRSYFSRSGVTLEPSLKTLALIPGNHDRYADLAATPNGDQFDKVFGGSLWDGAARCKRKVIEKEGHILGIIGIDFSLFPGARVSLKERFGMGDASPTLLDALKAETERLRSDYDGVCICWMMHFPPCFPNVSIDLRLNNDGAVLALAEELRVQTILAGHVHSTAHYIRRGVNVVCAGTATSLAGDDFSLNLIDLEIEQASVISTRVVKYRYQDGDEKDDFIADSVVVGQHL